MTNFTSRLLVAAVGLPLVLGMLWLGGWWLFTLLAVASVVAVHEFVTTARPLRPLAPAVYGGVLLAHAAAGPRPGGRTSTPTRRASVRRRSRPRGTTRLCSSIRHPV